MPHDNKVRGDVDDERLFQSALASLGLRPGDIRPADFFVDDGSLVSRMMAAAPAAAREELEAALEVDDVDAEGALNACIGQADRNPRVCYEQPHVIANPILRQNCLCHPYHQHKNKSVLVSKRITADVCM